MSKTILIIDDDPSILEVSGVRFRSAGFSVLTAERGEKGLDLLRRNRVDLVVLDVKMPGMGGKKALEEIQSRWPGLPVIILTAYGSIQDAVEAVRNGAADYVTKPYDGAELLERVKKYLSEGMARMSSSPESSISERIWGGQSPAMQRLFDLIVRVAPTDSDVLITGESGTGKELVARELHERSHRAQGPFTVVDCSTTSSTLLESELFGHRKGAFTNAYQDRKGLIQAAEGGTLFLDEIGTISPEMQAKLLRFLQERTIRRVGETRETAVDCRVLAATNADVRELLRRGEFREDLYFRLKGFTVRVPPLRERREDIPSLAEQFLARFCREAGRPSLAISPEAMQALMDYSWPGNVRELQQVLKTGAILCRGGELQAGDLQLEIGEEGEAGSSNSGFSLEDSERQTIVRALEQCGWVQKRAAKLLGISRRAINYKIKRHNIAIPKR
jgi:DNA-binding NtrC family response regulator